MAPNWNWTGFGVKNKIHAKTYIHAKFVAIKIAFMIMNFPLVSKKTIP